MKIGFLTSGGDCQALNAAMRGTAKYLYENETITGEEFMQILERQQKKPFNS